MERLVSVMLLMGVAIVTETQAQKLVTVCQQGWTKGYERCYFPFRTAKSWQAANDHCKKYGARLGEPTGYLVNEWLADLWDISVNSFWIGYNVIGYQGNDVFSGMWGDGRATDVSVGVWAEFEPNTYRGKCTYVNLTTNQHLWYMDSCDRLLPFVCEMSPCPEGSFQCANSHCVGNMSLCNRVDDCGDMSDERDCRATCTFYQTGLEGEVVSPEGAGIGQYPDRAMCTWLIQGPPESYIQINVTDFDLEYALDYVEVWVGGATVEESQCLTRLTGELSQIESSFSSFNNFLIIRFFSDGSNQDVGNFRLSWYTEYRCELSLLENKRETDGQSGGVMSIPEGEDIAYCVGQCEESINCMGLRYVPGEEMCYFLPEVAIPVQENGTQLYVKSCPGVRGHPVYPRGTLPSSGGTVTATHYPQQLHTPFYPLHHPGDMGVDWIIQSPGREIVTVQIKDVDLCGNDIIKFRDGDDLSSDVLLTLTSGSNGPTVVMTTGSRMLVSMRLTEHLACRGIILTYIIGCEFDILANSKRVFSPGYDVKNYPNQLQCGWKFRSKSGRPISIKFMDFHTQMYKDYVKLYDGLTSQDTPLHDNLGLSGEATGTIITGTSAAMLMSFSTGAYGQDTGFTAIFSSACTDLVTDTVNVSPKSNNIHLDDQLTVTCQTGHYFLPPYEGMVSVVLTCLEAGVFDQATPECKLSYCGPVHQIQHGFVEWASGVMGEDLVIYRCWDGYTADRNLTVVCGADGNWGTRPSCLASECPVRHPVLNGHMEIVYGNGTEDGTILKSSCDNYYELIGQSTVTCQNGLWSTDLPECSKRRCGKQMVTNASLSVTIDDMVYVGDTVIVTCKSGFSLSGADRYRCGVDSPPSCENIDECLTSSPCHSTQTCTDNIGGYTCTCPVGFKPSTTDPNICEDINECLEDNGYCQMSCQNTPGSYFCRCLIGGTLYLGPGVGQLQGLGLFPGETGLDPWNSYHTDHSCVATQCPLPMSDYRTSDRNGRALTLKTIFLYKDTVTYLCNIGYTMKGTGLPTHTRVCQADGTWSTPVPECEEVTCDSNTVDPDSLHTQVNYGEYIVLTCASPDGSHTTRKSYCTYHPAINKYSFVGSCASDCSSVQCMNGGVCEDLTITCRCVPGYTGEYCQFWDQKAVCISGMCGDRSYCYPFYVNESHVCRCLDGYTEDGSRICQKNNYCAMSPCQNGGTCYNGVGRYYCVCVPGYGGLDCRYDYNECVSLPCKNGGTCSEIKINDYSCSCPAGTIGKNCEDIDECASSPCDAERSVQCFNLANDYYCQCKANFYGKTCSNGDSCDSNPCQHGSTCVPVGVSYICKCAPHLTGVNCEKELDKCGDNPCQNSGTCYNRVTDYTCVCPYNFIGKNCDVNYDLCSLANHCIGPNSTCSVDVGGSVTCECAPDYTGTGCINPKVRCEAGTCNNGGTCYVVNKHTQCSCPSGYSGEKCDVNINECESNPCASGALCEDGINGYRCLCPNGKLGFNCNKDIQYDFDFVLQNPRVCETLNTKAFFTLNSTSLSISVWFRFSERSEGDKNIVSVYGLWPNNTKSPFSQFLIRSQSVLTQVGDSVSVHGISQDLMNGQWHHLVVTWNNEKDLEDGGVIGRVTLYVDNMKHGNSDSIGSNVRLPPLGMLVIGGTYDESTNQIVRSNGIIGRISRLFIVRKELDAAVLINDLYSKRGSYIPVDTVHDPVIYHIEHGPLTIDYNSEVAPGGCLTQDSCPGRYQAANYVSVKYCPKDQYVTFDRNRYTVWTTQQFDRSVVTTMNMYPGAVQLDVGVYGVSAAGLDRDGNAAMCTYKIFIKRSDCRSLNLPNQLQENPVGGQRICSSNGASCRVTCNNPNQQPMRAGPAFYSCSKYGQYDRDDRLIPFIYPSCADAKVQRFNVTMTLNFDLPETCVDTPSLKAKLTASLSTLNFVWSRSLCEQSDCSNEVTDVECQDTRKIGVNVQLHLVPGDIKNSITNTASTPSELLAAAIDNKELTIQGSVADVMSLDILIQGPSCLDRHQVVGNYCVECGPGTYFSFQSKTCDLCAKGHYQNLWGQTSCKACPDNSPMTWGQGTTSISNCYIECTSGHYYDYRDGIKTCLACPRGTYQPLDGSFYCLECDLSLTTASSGTKDSKDCIDLDLTSTEADNNEGNNLASGRSMAADEGLSDDIVIVIAVLCFLILIVLVIFILVCLCKDKISFLNYNDVDPDELTQKSRFGEAKIDFITRRLNKVRHQRGAQPINDKRYQRQSYHYHDDTSYYEDDPMSPRHYQHLPSQYVRYPRENESYAASIHLRKYEESLTDGHTTKRSRRLAPLDGSRLAEVITKSKSKKKRKSGKESRKKVNKELHGESEAPTKTHEVPLNVLPDSSELKESGWLEGRTKNKTSTHVQPEINPNTFSDSEASDVDIGRIGRKSKKTSQA